MEIKVLRNAVLLILWIGLVNGFSRPRGPSEIDITEPCQFPVALGLEKKYIPDQNMWASSQINAARGAHLARLRGWVDGNKWQIHGKYEGGGAWTSGVPNNKQYLGVDVGARQVIAAIATQGRRGSNEFVTEYFLEFSTDNKTWTIYTNKYGTPYMFEANTDDDGIVRNDLPYPIVARYIRINPQRWTLFISLRLELYGCPFEGDGVTLDGQSRLTLDVSGQNDFIHTRQDIIKLRFRTNQADGLILFADGNQGDYLILELVRGRLHLSIDLGSTAQSAGDTTMRAGSLLDDNQWHDVEISRSDRNINLTVDRLTITNMTNGDFYRLDIDREIQLGGLNNFFQPGKVLQSLKNFTGCLENVWYNYANLIQDARNAKNKTRYSIHGAVLFGSSCAIDPIIPFTFPTMESYLKFDKSPDAILRTSFDFRSFNADGLLFYTLLHPAGRFQIKLNYDGLLEYKLQTANDPEVKNTIENLDSLSESLYFTDGLWHSVIIEITPSVSGKVGKMNITVDGRPNIANRVMGFTTTQSFYLGGGDADGGETGFLGCMRRIVVMGELMSNLPVNSNQGGVLNGTCALQDRCDPNPCEHMAVCSQNYFTFTCDCKPTGYEGAVCHKSKYLVSCQEAMMLNPTLPDMQVYVDIDDSGKLDPFPVRCIFDNQQGWLGGQSAAADLDTSVWAVTELYHDSGAETLVNGFADPGSYSRAVRYDATYRELLDAFIERTFECEQYIKYTCFQSKLLADAGSSGPSIPSWGWWVGRTNKNEVYWGGSSPGSSMCACGLKNECKSASLGTSLNKCNCDAGLAQDDVFDDGYLNHKEDLPVMELRFGDTGTIDDQKWGKYLLGPLRCQGDNCSAFNLEALRQGSVDGKLGQSDIAGGCWGLSTDSFNVYTFWLEMDLFENVVTFRKADATIDFPTFDAATSGDIRLQFRTTAMNGILLQNTGPFDFIELKIVLGNIMQFRYDVGNGVQTLERTTAYPLNDNSWHTVHIERNRKQAMLKVDQQAWVVLDEPTDQSFKSLNLDSPLVIGAAVDYSDGFVGCIRALMVNGEIMDLRGKVERGEVTYGVQPGCHGKCESSPCFNNGICTEWYDHYTCDCAYTPYRGWDCGREMGVNMMPVDMIRYEFDQETGSISTDEEQIIIGFATQEKKGMLMHISNSETNPVREYISVEVNNNVGFNHLSVQGIMHSRPEVTPLCGSLGVLDIGGVKVIIDVGFQRDEVNTDIQNVDLSNNQQHVVNVKRSNKGRTMTVQVDTYPAAIKSWDYLPSSADTRLDNPQYVYFGRNDSTKPGDGFKGCLFRAQFDNLFPISRVFQDPRPSSVYVEGNIREDMCGFEEVTQKPEPVEVRPTPPLPPEYSTKSTPMPGYHGMLSPGEIALIASCTIIGFLLIVTIVIMFVHYTLRSSRQYVTLEDENAAYFDEADHAIAAGAEHQPGVQRNKEYYI